VAIVDAEGWRHASQYDNNRRLTQQWQPYPASPGNPPSDVPFTKYEYDASNQLLKQSQYVSSDATSPLWTKSWEYDEHGNMKTSIGATPILTEASAPQQSNVAPVVSYAYDALGMLRYETDPRGTSGIGGTLRRASYAYDSMGRTIRTVEAINGALLHTPPTSVTTYDVAGRVTSVTTDTADGNRGTTTYAYNLADELTSVTHPSTASGALSEAYEYDGRGNCYGPNCGRSFGRIVAVGI
jgi:YD repeat-containing protein